MKGRVKTDKGKPLARLTHNRAKSLKSNKKACPKGANSPGPNYGHGGLVKKAPGKIW
jgi:hypothetical protein